MLTKTKLPFRLSVVITALMIIQSILGLLFQDQYRDVDWIKATWFGNDLVTLIIAVPLLILALNLVRRGSIRGLLLWLGMTWYAVYNYTYYLFGAALNSYLPLYIVLIVLAMVVLILILSSIDAAGIQASFRTQTPVRLIGGYLVFSGTGLAAVWLLMWAGYIFAGKPTPIETEAFKIVAAIDLLMISTVQLLGGVQLWRRQAWGNVVAAMATSQGAIYLVVLSVNSVIAIQRGTAEAPGEVPLWGTMAALTIAATVLLLVNVRRKQA